MLRGNIEDSPLIRLVYFCIHINIMSPISKEVAFGPVEAAGGCTVILKVILYASDVGTQLHSKILMKVIIILVVRLLM